MKSKIIASTLIGLGFLLGASALSALAVWTGAPAGTPPNCPTNPTNPDGSANVNYREGCNAPINAGATAQSKLGSLSTLGLGIIGDFKFLPLGGVAPTTGQVLMADDSDLTHGKVKWGSVAGSGGSGGTQFDHGFAPNNPINPNPYSSYGPTTCVTFHKTFSTIPDVVVTWNYFAQSAQAPAVFKVTTTGFCMSGDNMDSVGTAPFGTNPYGHYWIAIAN